jgi:hypothetical protein
MRGFDSAGMMAPYSLMRVINYCHHLETTLGWIHHLELEVVGSVGNIYPCSMIVVEPFHHLIWTLVQFPLDLGCLLDDFAGMIDPCSGALIDWSHSR